MDEEHEDPDDRLPDILQELYAAEQAVQSGEKSMFAAVLEEMKELHPGSDHSRFSFLVKLLHIKSFYRISNVAFNAIATEVMSILYCCDCECEMAFWDVVTCVFVLVMLPDYST